MTKDTIKEQFINLGDPITEETRIYRVFSQHRLFETFRDKKLTLVAPWKWDDPFENFLAKCKARVHGINQDVNVGPLFKNFYGQCWTLNVESDAMWRIYSHDKGGSRVSTTAGRLLRSIYDRANVFASMSYYIGSVGYQSEAELRRFFEDPEKASGVVFDSTGRGHAMILLLKRPEFVHEAEVRLLYRFNANGSSEVRPEETWQFSVDPNALFDDVLFDPRMDEASFRASEKKLRDLGFSKPVDQSMLYRLPELRICLQ